MPRKSHERNRLCRGKKTYRKVGHNENREIIRTNY